MWELEHKTNGQLKYTAEWTTLTRIQEMLDLATSNKNKH